MRHTISLFLSIIILPAIGQTINLAIRQESSLIIEGKSNVNEFNCRLATVANVRDVNVNYHLYPDSIVFEDTKIEFPINDFICDNQTMTRDFRELLKSEAYPTIDLTARVAAIHQLDNTGETQANIELKIAGTSKTIRTGFYDVSYDSDRIQFSGFQHLKLSDFDLDPPRYLFGIIEVKDEINIDLQISMDIKKAGY